MEQSQLERASRFAELINKYVLLGWGERKEVVFKIRSDPGSALEESREVREVRPGRPRVAITYTNGTYIEFVLSDRGEIVFMNVRMHPAVFTETNFSVDRSQQRLHARVDSDNLELLRLHLESHDAKVMGRAGSTAVH